MAMNHVCRNFQYTVGLMQVILAMLERSVMDLGVSPPGGGFLLCS